MGRVAIVLVLIASLTGLPGAAAVEGHHRRADAPVPAAGSTAPLAHAPTRSGRATTPYAQASTCRTDATGDVLRFDDGTVGAAPGEVDITRWCVDLGEDGLSFAMTTAAGVTAGFDRSQGAHALTVLGGGDQVDLNVWVQDGTLRAPVFGSASGDLRCEGEVALDGGYVEVLIPASCLPSSDVLSVAAFLVRDVHYDEEPASPDLVDIPRHSGPAVDRDGFPAGAQSPAQPSPTLFDGDPATTERLVAGTPQEAAVRISQLRFPAATAGHAVIARDDQFADALAASPLTADGPLLLVQSQSLPASVFDELRRVLPPGGTVYVLGGPAAVSEGVEGQIRDAGYPTTRLAGDDRIVTAIAVATEVARRYHGGTPPTVAIARAFGEGSAGWADSVSGGAWAADTLTPLFITPTGALDDRVAQAVGDLGASQAVVLGGPAAVADAVLSRLPAPRRVAGPDRAATAAQVAADLWGPTSRYLVINGYRNDGWGYGLAAAGLAASEEAPLLLAGDTLPPASAARVGLGCGSGSPAVDVAVIGGDAIVPATVVQQIDSQDGGTCAPPPPPPAPPGPPPPPPPPGGPRGLNPAVEVGPGHLTSAGPRYTYWTEFTTASSSCVEDGRERILVQDTDGSRRQTTVPGVTFAGLDAELSPDGRFATVTGFCDDGWFMKGYASVTDTGDLVGFQPLIGSGTYDESSLHWRPDGLLYGLVDVSPDPFSYAQMQLHLVDPASGQRAVVLSWQPNVFVNVLVHTADVTVIEYFGSDGSDIEVYDGSGRFLTSYSLADSYATASPDGEWLVAHDFSRTEMTAYRVADLRGGSATPVRGLAPSGDYIAGLMWSDSGQLAVEVVPLTGAGGVARSTDIHVWDPATGLSAQQSVPLAPEACEYVFFSDWSATEDQVFLGKDSGCGQRVHSALSLSVQR